MLLCRPDNKSDHGRCGYCGPGWAGGTSSARQVKTAADRLWAADQLVEQKGKGTWNRRCSKSNWSCSITTWFSWIFWGSWSNSCWQRSATFASSQDVEKFASSDWCWWRLHASESLEQISRVESITKWAFSSRCTWFWTLWFSASSWSSWSWLSWVRLPMQPWLRDWLCHADSPERPYDQSRPCPIVLRCFAAPSWRMPRSWMLIWSRQKRHVQSIPNVPRRIGELWWTRHWCWKLWLGSRSRCTLGFLRLRQEHSIQHHPQSSWPSTSYKPTCWHLSSRSRNQQRIWRCVPTTRTSWCWVQTNTPHGWPAETAIAGGLHQGLGVWSRRRRWRMLLRWEQQAARRM